MADRETIMTWLKKCGNGGCSSRCPYDDLGPDKCYETLMTDALELLKEQPEQKHGHWKLIQDYDDEHWQCSACGCEWYLEAGNPEENNMHYCPECGAKMDEEVSRDE